MQPGAVVDVSDVHPRTLTHSLKALEDRDAPAAVIGGRLALRRRHGGHCWEKSWDSSPDECPFDLRRRTCPEQGAFSEGREVYPGAPFDARRNQRTFDAVFSTYALPFVPKIPAGE